MSFRLRGQAREEASAHGAVLALRLILQIIQRIDDRLIAVGHCVSHGFSEGALDVEVIEQCRH